MSSTNPLLTFAARGTQALFAIVVFGLSTTLIKGHKFGSVPATLGLVTFIGGISFVAAVLGIASNWILVLQGKLGMLLDIVVAGLNIAGGILLAIKLKGVQCVEGDCSDGYEARNCKKLRYSDIICGGMWETEGLHGCWWFDIDEMKVLLSRCKTSQADSVFMFLTALLVAAMAALVYLRLKRGY